MTHRKLNTPARHLLNLHLPLGRGDTGFEVTGAGHSIQRCTTSDGGFGIKLIAPTSGVVIHDFTSVDQQNSGNNGYGIFASTGGQPVWHDGLVLSNPLITFNRGSTAQHCIRLYGVRNWTILGGTLCNLATYSATSPHTGASLNVKQASGLRICGLNTQGKPPGFENDRTNPGEANYVIEDVLIVGARFDINTDWLETVKSASPFRIGGNVRRFKVIQSTIIQRNAKAPVIEVAKGATDIEFIDCIAAGGSKLFADGQYSQSVPFSGNYNSNPIS